MQTEDTLVLKKLKNKKTRKDMNQSSIVAINLKKYLFGFCFTKPLKMEKVLENNLLISQLIASLQSEVNNQFKLVKLSKIE